MMNIERSCQRKAVTIQMRIIFQLLFYISLAFSPKVSKKDAHAKSNLRQRVRYRSF